ncbi:MAG: NAD(+)/NADH kinase [Acetatifactor sp.]|nr:NAD(+)/NADH kinase [Acetatifactor sp.]
MKHFLIYTNTHKDKNLSTTGHIREYLETKGQRVTVWADESRWREKQGTDDREDVLQAVSGDVDCMVVLGGDGTVLQAARDARRLNIPIIGVNLGTLGYMTEIEPDGLEEALDRLIAGDYQQESRMMLKGTAFLPEGRTEEGWALNDIVISRSGSLQIIKFNIYVNGQFLHDYDADGVIVTTPTGSTGYNLSAGGPLVEPKAKLILVTPICPHTLNQRSIILSPEDVVDIEILQGREDRTQTVEANFDGRHVIPLRTGDRMRIVKSEKSTEFIQLNRVSFLEVLHKKMAD